MDCTHRYSSPLGGITMACDGTALTGMWFDGQRYFAGTLSADFRESYTPVFAETERWLDIYFSGRNPGFTPPLRLKGTPFRRAVWEILLTVPYGATVTYGQIAEILAARKKTGRMSARAVGNAVGHNPVSLIVPCHRVIGADGSITGYAGGPDKKEWLLQLERTGGSRSP